METIFLHVLLVTHVWDHVQGVLHVIDHLLLLPEK
jgi:hypothetical protein